jgi:hypothetical protein
MFWLFACGEGEKSGGDTAIEESMEEVDPTYQFTIAILADPYILGNVEHSA